MKKFTMLGAVMLLVGMTQVLFSTENAKTAGGEKTAKISATVEGSTLQSDYLVADLNSISTPAGETKESYEAKAAVPKDQRTMATMEVSTLQSDHMVANDVIWENTAATEIKTGYAMEVAGILPDETVLFSNCEKTGSKYQVENKSCTCANCIAQNAAVVMGGNSA